MLPFDPLPIREIVSSSAARQPDHLLPASGLCFDRRLPTGPAILHNTINNHRDHSKNNSKDNDVKYNNKPQLRTHELLTLSISST